MDVSIAATVTATASSIELITRITPTITATAIVSPALTSSLLVTAISSGIISVSNSSSLSSLTASINSATSSRQIVSTALSRIDPLSVTRTNLSPFPTASTTNSSTGSSGLGSTDITIIVVVVAVLVFAAIAIFLFKTQKNRRAFSNADSLSGLEARTIKRPSHASPGSHGVNLEDILGKYQKTEGTLINGREPAILVVNPSIPRGHSDNPSKNYPIVAVNGPSAFNRPASFIAPSPMTPNLAALGTEPIEYTQQEIDQWNAQTAAMIYTRAQVDDWCNQLIRDGFDSGEVQDWRNNIVIKEQSEIDAWYLEQQQN